MLNLKLKAVRKNKILYSSSDRSDIIPANNTTYLSMRKFYKKDYLERS
jgi:hypothetical protein